jgi:multidrug resistance efflux pump
VLLSVRVTVDGQGTLEPVRIWPVRARVAGTVSEVLVHSGDTVRIGQPLVRLDTLAASVMLAQLEAQLAAQRLEYGRLARLVPIEQQEDGGAMAQAGARRLRARAALRERLADLGMALADMDSLLRAHRPGVHVGVDIAVADVLGAEGELLAARAQAARRRLAPLAVAKHAAELRRVEAQLREGRALSARGVLVAPADGVVLTEQLERLPGTVLREGDEVLEVADVGTWLATLSVRERDVHRVRVSDHVLVDIPALRLLHEEPVAARVASVAAEPSRHVDASTRGTSSGIAGYRVVVHLSRAVGDSLGDVMRRGYEVRARIITRTVSGWTLAREWVRERLWGRTR